MGRLQQLSSQPPFSILHPQTPRAFGKQIPKSVVSTPNFQDRIWSSASAVRAQLLLDEKICLYILRRKSGKSIGFPEILEKEVGQP